MRHLLEKGYNNLRPREKMALKEKYKLNKLNQTIMNNLLAEENKRKAPNKSNKAYNNLRPREKNVIKEMNNRNIFNGSTSQWFNMVDNEGFHRRYAVELSHHLDYLPSKAKLTSMMRSNFADRLRAHFGHSMQIRNK